MPDEEPAVEETVSDGTDSGFGAFAVFEQKNIFDPNRRRYIPPEERREAEPEAPPPRREEVVLTGTLSYTKGTFAFFDGSDPSYRKTVRQGDDVAGFQVRSIGHDRVDLEREGVLISLPVGGQMQRTGDEAWEVTERTFTSGSDSPDRTGSLPSESDASADKEGPSEALKRLLEKRRQELNP